MNKKKFLSIRADEAEMARLKVLAGDMTVSQYMLARAFSVERPKGSEKEYPGWVVVEQGRRDRGIRITHSKGGEVMLYPEDDAYGQFVE